MGSVEQSQGISGRAILLCLVGNTPLGGLIHGSEPPIRRFRGVRDKFYNVGVSHGGTSVAA